MQANKSIFAAFIFAASCAAHAATIDLSYGTLEMDGSYTTVQDGIGLEVSSDQGRVVTSAAGMGVSRDLFDADFDNMNGTNEVLQFQFDQVVRIDRIVVTMWDEFPGDLLALDSPDVSLGINDANFIDPNYAMLVLDAPVIASEFSLEAVSEFAGLGLTSVRIASLEVHPVPVPAAAWLFGSALLGLAGLRRR